MNRIEAVIFDIDDTLVATSRCNRLCRAAALDRLLGEMQCGDIARAREVESYLYGIFGWARLPDLWRATAIELGAGVPSDELLKDMLHRFESEFVTRLELFPTVERTLMQLRDRGLRLGVISDGDPAWQWRKLKTTGLDRLFDPESVCISIQSDLHNCKPATANFRRQERVHDLPPVAFAYVGDRPNDIIGANVAGWTSVRTRQVNNDGANHWPLLPAGVEIPDHEIDTLSHIMDLL